MQLIEYTKQHLNISDKNSTVYKYHKWFLDNATIYSKINIEESEKMSKYAIIKRCYHNCYKLAMTRKNLEYIEGYTMSLIPIEHAFLINKKNEVIDPTLGLSRDRIGSEYMGIKIPKHILKKLFNKRGYTPLPFLYWEYLKGDLELD